VRRASAIGLAVLGLAIAAPAVGGTRGVLVKDDSFSPRARTAAPGDVIRFKWRSTENPHDVKFTRAPRGARKPRKCSLRTSGRCKRRVAKRGVYRYVCTIHLASDNMRGRIVVR